MVTSTFMTPGDSKSWSNTSRVRIFGETSSTLLGYSCSDACLKWLQFTVTITASLFQHCRGNICRPVVVEESVCMLALVCVCLMPLPLLPLSTLLLPLPLPGKEKLSKSVAEQRWDRMKVVCTQPYNKVILTSLCMYQSFP